MRQVLIPLATILCLLLLPATYRPIGTVIIMVNAAPVGSNVAVYSQRLGKDAAYAARVVCLSTLLSIVTLPLIVAAASALGFA